MKGTLEMNESAPHVIANKLQLKVGKGWGIASMAHTEILLEPSPASRGQVLAMPSAWPLRERVWTWWRPTGEHSWGTPAPQSSLRTRPSLNVPFSLQIIIKKKSESASHVGRMVLVPPIIGSSVGSQEPGPSRHLAVRHFPANDCPSMITQFPERRCLSP